MYINYARHWTKHFMVFNSHLIPTTITSSQVSFHKIWPKGKNLNVAHSSLIMGFGVRYKCSSGCQIKAWASSGRVRGNDFLAGEFELHEEGHGSDSRRRKEHQASAVEICHVWARDKEQASCSREQEPCRSFEEWSCGRDGWIPNPTPSKQPDFNCFSIYFRKNWNQGQNRTSHKNSFLVPVKQLSPKPWS